MGKQQPGSSKQQHITSSEVVAIVTDEALFPEWLIAVNEQTFEVWALGMRNTSKAGSRERLGIAASESVIDQLRGVRTLQEVKDILERKEDQDNAQD